MLEATRWLATSRRDSPSTFPDGNLVARARLAPILGTEPTLGLDLAYNSIQASRASTYGLGWRSNAGPDVHLDFVASDQIRLTDETGYEEMFTRTGDGTYTGRSPGTANLNRPVRDFRSLRAPPGSRGPSMLRVRPLATPTTLDSN